MPYINSKTIIFSIISITILSFCSQRCFSQLIDGGQNPPSVKFRQINTERFQIIYPTPLEFDAQKVANTLEAVVADVSKSLGRQPKPISIILQNQGVQSNGFVTMAPRHSEFYTMPGQEFDAQDWLNSLAVHELRHVVQFDNLAPNLGAPLFEELKLALFGINLPAWFFEGDAVGIETALSKAGRGRLPAFEQTLRTNILSQNKFSYSKNYFGSYKNFVSGYYPMGYFMTTKIRKDNGPKILSNILTRIKDLPFRPYNFSSSLKKFTGIGTRQLYLQTMAEMEKLWSAQEKKIKLEQYPVLNPTNIKNPSNYLLPQIDGKGRLLCLKNSFTASPLIITIGPQKKEEVLVKIGPQTEANFSLAKDLICWDEIRVDSRYQQRTFSVICTYNLTTKKYRQLTHKTRLFSPSFSADGKKIIAVKVSQSNHFNLVELDAESGNLLKEFPNPENYTLQTPAYNNDATKIIVTVVCEKGKSLLLYEGDNARLLLPFTTQLIARPIFWNKQIIFKAHYNGIENIYLLTERGETRQLSHSRFGANYPYVNRGQLYFSDYSANGYNIASLDLRRHNDAHAFHEKNTFVEYYSSLISQENASNILESVDSVRYPSKPYPDFSHVFYFHSLRPSVTENQYNNDYNLGFDLISNNKLNTAAASLGYQYNSALHSGSYSANFSYQKYYPKLSLSYRNRPRLAYTKIKNQTDSIIVPFTWREHYSSLDVSIPYAKNWLNKSLYGSFTVSTSYTQRYNQNMQVSGFLLQNVFPLNYRFAIGINSQRSARDLAPRWGQNLEFNYEHAPFDKKLVGSNFFVKSAFYFPGLAPNHSFSASLNFQTNSGVYLYHADIPRANGWANMPGILKLKNTLLLSYRFPVAYPDWELGPIAYVKRIKGCVFSDFENINAGNGLRGYGLDLSADMNLLRYYLPIFEFGGKIIIPAESATKKPIFELGINFNY